MSMLKVNAFDSICHEHYEYYRLTDVINLLKKFGLEVFDVSHNDTNGSSVRIFAGFKGKHKVKQVVKEKVTEENLYFSQGDQLLAFSNRVRTERNKLMRFFNKTLKAKAVIGALGASTKGNTLLQYYGLNYPSVLAIGEVNDDKYGLKTAGSNIPIISEKDLLDKKPDYIIILPWHFKTTFIPKLVKYMEGGGAIIFPLPQCEVVRMEYGRMIREYISDEIS
jgi:hypothetical protein